MVKYILKRLGLGILSACIVTIIVMVLVFSLIDRQAILASDTIYNKKQANEQEVYKYERWADFGYIDYISYNNFLNDEIKQGNLDSEQKADAKKLGKKKYEEGTYIASDDTDLCKEYITKFVSQYENSGFKIVRLNPVFYKGNKIANGGNPQLFAYRDKPLITRIGKFFTGLIHIDTIHYAENIQGDRGLSLTMHDPAYGGDKFAPAIMGNGTQYKYLVYFDGQFPFMHFNFIKIRLGTSFTVNQGRDVWDTMTDKQDPKITEMTYYPSGVSANSSDDIHTLEYVDGSYSDINPVIMERFVDNYTSTITTKAGKSQMGYSFTIGIIATLLAYVFGLPIGVLMAKYKNRLFDKIGTIYIVFIIAVPSLAYIFMFKALGGALFKLPTQFFLDTERAAQYGALIYILPIVSIALPSIAGRMQWTRRYMIDQTNSDYVKFARSGGLSEGEIFRKHIFKNAAIPIVHGIPGAILGSLTGAIITERIYSVPGVGNVLTKAINAYDNSVIVGVTFFYALLSVISIMLGDVLMLIMDPRISVGTKSR